MERVKNSVDVSPFLLVEAAGDSEVDSGPATSTTVVADDDDAESCSCDTSDHSCVINGAFSEVEGGRANYNVADDDHADKEEEEVEEGVEVCQSWFGQVHVGLPVKQKPCVSVDSGNESMNEKEKDRLFWEACLAS